jgi:hypothetical protein
MDYEIDLGRRGDALSEEDPFGGVLSKLPGCVARLASTLHTTKFVTGEIANFDQLDERTMSEAIKLGDYFLSHATRVWARLSETQEDSHVRSVRRWMEAQGRPVTGRDILRASLTGLRRSTEVRSVITQMADSGIVRPLKIGKRECFKLVTARDKIGNEPEAS